MATRADPEWADIESELRWLAVVPADEEDVDAWATEDESVRGFGRYLAEGRDEEASSEYMKGRLSNDVVRRRKIDQPRPYGEA